MTSCVLVTGANRGIGLRLAGQYAADGWRVHACCRDPGNRADLRQAVAGHDAVVHALDVGDRRSIDALKAELGDEPIDVLINNAGVGGGDRQTFGDIDYEAWEETIRINTFGPYRVSEALADNVAGSEKRTIANISSRMGSIAECDEGGESIYRSSKTALNMVSLDLAYDLKARGVTVLALHPGWVRTDMGGAEAPITPEDAAAALRRTIAAATFADSGSFLDYDGTRLPW